MLGCHSSKPVLRFHPILLNCSSNVAHLIRPRERRCSVLTFSASVRSPPASFENCKPCRPRFLFLRVHDVSAVNVQHSGATHHAAQRRCWHGCILRWFVSAVVRYVGVPKRKHVWCNWSVLSLIVLSAIASCCCRSWGFSAPNQP